MFNQNLSLNANLGATLIRKDGTHRDIPSLSTGTITYKTALAKMKQPLGFWTRLWTEAKEKQVIAAAVTLAAFIASIQAGDASPMLMSLVTTSGINFMAADFLSASSARINQFKYIDCGTGTTAAAIGDTALQTAAGTARTSGTQSNPTSASYSVVGTVAFTGTLAITEFGLFSASTSGTLWDHRIFSAINVVNADSISFTYTVTLTAGGS